jgi:hypothetical protein
MRPLGISLHPTDNVIAFQYSVQRDSNIKGAEDFETKELRIKIPLITKENDVRLVAQKIVQSKSIIPPQWVSQIEDCLIEILHRKKCFDNENTNRYRHQPDDSIERKVDEIDQIYHNFYETDEEKKIMASRKLLNLCLRVANVEVIEKKYQLISVLSRILKDRGKCSVPLLSNVTKIFGVLSGFECFHPILTEYQIGSAALDLLDFEPKGYIGEGYDLIAARRKHVTNCACVCILLNLSDSFVVRTKMIKKGAINFLKTFIVNEKTKISSWMTLNLLHRLSIFGETSEMFSDTRGRRSLEYLIEKCRESPYLIARILFNFSFSKYCREAMNMDKCVHSVTKCVTDHGASEPILNLLFNLSLDQRFHSQFNENDDLLKYLTNSIVSDNNTKASHQTTSSILANLSILPKWAESLITYIGVILDRTISDQDFSSAVIIFNLSKWTYNIQEDISKAVADLGPPTVHSKQSKSKMNIHEQYWGEHVHSVINTIVSFIRTNKGITTLMTRTLSYFTNHDLPINLSWCEIDSTYTLFDTFSRYIASKECDLKLVEAICSVLNNIAIFSKTDLLSVINEKMLKNLCHCGCNLNGRKDPILHRELITLFQKLLLESEFIKIIRSFQDLFLEEIYISSQSGFRANKSIALNCLDLIILHRDKFHDMSTRAIYIRFRIWNSKWMERMLSQ